METAPGGPDRDAAAGRPGAADIQAVGVDFATRPGHAVVARARDGAELGSAVCESPHAVIERVPGATGERLASARALQDPEDCREALRVAVAAAMRSAGVDPSAVVAIGTDFTASTPMPVRRDGTPLCEVAGHDTSSSWAKMVIDLLLLALILLQRVFFARGKTGGLSPGTATT